MKVLFFVSTPVAACSCAPLCAHTNSDEQFCFILFQGSPSTNLLDRGNRECTKKHTGNYKVKRVPNGRKLNSFFQKKRLKIGKYWYSFVCQNFRKISSSNQQKKMMTLECQVSFLLDLKFV
jgi:hypothetical protein